MVGYAATIALGYLLILLLLRVFEPKLIFFPDYPGRLTGEWHPKGLPVQDTWIKTQDGVTLHAWWIPSPQARVTFLAFHGNAANIANRAELYRFLWTLPANVLAVEYRGYGRSEGKPSETGLYRDADAAYDYLVQEQHIPAERIISFGQSLGSAVAADLASRRTVAGVVLEGSFPSARAVAQKVYWFLPGISLVGKSKFDTAKKLASVRVPILIVHCVRDPVVSFSLGEEVYRQAQEPKFFLKVEGECHEEASLFAPETYRAELSRFLQSVSPAR